MGWFLSNKKTTKKKKTKRGKSAQANWDPQRTLLGVKFAGIAGAVLTETVSPKQRGLSIVIGTWLSGVCTLIGWGSGGLGRGRVRR